MQFSKNVKAVNVSGIRKMFELASRLQNPIDLSLGMPDIPVPKKVLDATIDHLQADKPGYSMTAGFLSVREAVANKLNQKNNIPATADQIIITNGATGALALSMGTLLDGDSEIIIIDPYFVLYTQIADFFNIKRITIPSYPDFRLPLEKISRAITSQTRAILINTPNNPTGVVYSKDELIKLAEIARQHDLAIISDEVYEEYIYDNKEHFSIGSIYPNTVTITGPSKTAALAGWRIGYLHAPQEITQEMIKLQQILYTCSPTPAQHALKTALNLDYSALRSAFQAKRDLVKNTLAKKFPVYGMEGSFYCFFEVGNDAEYVNKLLEKSVLIVPGSVFSGEKTHVRMAYCMKDDIIEKALAAINSI